MSNDTELPFDPSSVSIMLHGCCSYDDIWEPGIEGWGATDEESRAGGCVSVQEYDKLLTLYTQAKERAGELEKVLYLALKDVLEDAPQALSSGSLFTAQEAINCYENRVKV